MKMLFVKVLTSSWLVMSLSLVALAGFTNAEAREPSRPNIIFLLTDDQRYDTMGITGNTVIQTPELDKLGGEGVVFDRSYVVSSACAPNRAAILSGMYNRSSGVRDFSTSFSQAMQENLYPMILHFLSPPTTNRRLSKLYARVGLPHTAGNDATNQK